MVQILIEGGAMVDLADGMGFTPVMHACRYREGDGWMDGLVD